MPASSSRHSPLLAHLRRSRWARLVQIIALMHWTLIAPVHHTRADDEPITETTSPEDPSTSANTSTETSTASETAGNSASEPDSDGDGIPDSQEQQEGTNPYTPDTDHDGITDADELSITNTDPTTSDSNGDGVSDFNQFYGNTTINTDISGPGVTPYDFDGDGIPDPSDPNPTDPINNEWDTDGDYVVDSQDSDPNNAALWNDWNHNGWNDDAEPVDNSAINPNDLDGDGAANDADSNPEDPLLWNDWNWNGTNDDMEDSDGDGVINSADSHPNNNTLWCDWNGNGMNDDIESGVRDSDGDGYPDGSDTHPQNPALWNDQNNNGINDEDENTSTDGDGDGHPDANDSNPADAALWSDWDHDGINDDQQSQDADGDGHIDSQDTDPNNSMLWEDYNRDGINDSQQTSPVDSDGDGHPDDADTHPSDAALWNDHNYNGINDEFEIIAPLDSDGDGVADAQDSDPNNVTLWNDWNHDGVADDAYTGDQDSDGDGYLDRADSNPNDPGRWNDWNDNGINDEAEVVSSSATMQGESSVVGGQQPAIDSDGDGLPDDQEALYHANPNQADTDGDGLTDGEEAFSTHTACDLVDTDGDTATDYEEVMAFHSDPLRPDRIAICYPTTGPITGNLTSLIPTENDLDGDGIPNDIEQFYAPFLNYLNPADAFGDLDGDGISNLDEYLAGTVITGRSKAFDTDGDGITDIEEDYWSLKHPGLLNKTRFTDAYTDPDGDGLLTITEVLEARRLKALPAFAGEYVPTTVVALRKAYPEVIPASYVNISSTGVVLSATAKGLRFQTSFQSALQSFNSTFVAGQPDRSSYSALKEFINWLALDPGEARTTHATLTDSQVLAWLKESFVGTAAPTVTAKRMLHSRDAIANFVRGGMLQFEISEARAANNTQTVNQLTVTFNAAFTQNGARGLAGWYACLTFWHLDMTDVLTTLGMRKKRVILQAVPSGFLAWRDAKYANVSAAARAALPAPIPPAKDDQDKDGMPNAWEAYYNLNYLSSRDGFYAGRYIQKRPPDPNPAWKNSTDPVLRTLYTFDATMCFMWDLLWAQTDPDHDGLSNLWEYQLGTNPRIADSDGDGFNDGVEVAAGAAGAATNKTILPDPARLPPGGATHPDDITNKVDTSDPLPTLEPPTPTAYASEAHLSGDMAYLNFSSVLQTQMIPQKINGVYSFPSSVRAPQFLMIDSDPLFDPQRAENEGWTRFFNRLREDLRTMKPVFLWNSVNDYDSVTFESSWIRDATKGNDGSDTVYDYVTQTGFVCSVLADSMKYHDRKFDFIATRAHIHRVEGLPSTPYFTSSRLTFTVPAGRRWANQINVEGVNYPAIRGFQEFLPLWPPPDLPTTGALLTAAEQEEGGWTGMTLFSVDLDVAGPQGITDDGDEDHADKTVVVYPGSTGPTDPAKHILQLMIRPFTTALYSMANPAVRLKFNAGPVDKPRYRIYSDSSLSSQVASQQVVSTDPASLTDANNLYVVPVKDSGEAPAGGERVILQVRVGNQWIDADEVRFRLLPVEVKDADRVLTSLPTTDDGMTTPAEESNIAFITPHSGFGDQPEMPKVKISIPGASTVQAEWRLSVEYKRPNGKQLGEDKVGFPSTEPSDYMPARAAADAWQLENDQWWNREIQVAGFFGGVSKVYLKIGSQDMGEVFRFRIGGRKPDSGLAKTAIDAAASRADQKLVNLSYAVARHESKDYNGEGTRYNQFWEGNGHRFSADHCRGDPLWCRGTDEDSAGGFGMFQITGDATHGKFYDVPRKVLWDWRENLTAYLGIVKTEGAASKAAWWENVFMPWVQQHEGAAYRDPPATTTYDGRTLTSWEMEVITLYNGAGGCPKQEYNNGASWKRSPWHFDGPGWSYHKNQDQPDGYLHNVLLEANQ